MSLICGALTWLKDHENVRIEELKHKINDLSMSVEEEDDNDWIAAAVKEREKQDQKTALKKELDFLLNKIEKIKELRKKRQTIQHKEVKKLDSDFDDLFRDAKEVQDELKKEFDALQNGLTPEENEHFLEDYFSDDDEVENDGTELNTDENKDFTLRVI